MKAAEESLRALIARLDGLSCHLDELTMYGKHLGIEEARTFNSLARDLWLIDKTVVEELWRARDKESDSKLPGR